MSATFNKPALCAVIGLGCAGGALLVNPDGLRENSIFASIGLVLLCGFLAVLFTKSGGWLRTLGLTVVYAATAAMIAAFTVKEWQRGAHISSRDAPGSNVNPSS